MKNEIQHYAVTDYSELFIQNLISGKLKETFPAVEQKSIAFFSEFTLEKFIEEDYRHGSSELVKNGSIRTFSTGEKRKALLKYLVRKNPDVLILDNPFDALDVAAVKDLRQNLEQISKDISIIQLLKRKEDLLPFIKQFILVKNGRIIETLPVDQFQFHKELGVSGTKNIEIPAPLHPFQNIPDELVSLNQVSVFYEERPILKNITWIIKKGEFWQLSGPNGSGKTTLLSMIYGDNPKAYGQDISIFGKKKGSGESVWEIKKKIGYFTPNLTEMFKANYSLKQMVISGLFDSIGLYQKPTHREISLAEEWLHVLELFGEKDQIFQKASRLIQQKVLIARAMIKHPPLLILDEPTTGMDDESALLFVNFINKIAQQSDMTIMYVSHRKEKGLSPQFEYRLSKTEHGSTGEIIGSKM